MKAITPQQSTLTRQLSPENTALFRDDIKYLRSILNPDQSGKINEEQLFSGIIEERVKVLKGTAIATKFHELFEKAKTRIGKQANAIENAARRALKNLVKDGTLTSKQAVKIHSEAFAAAQIDTNQATLFDSTGGPKDPTVAVKLVDQAVNTAIDRLNEFDSGKATAQSRQIIAVKHTPGSIVQ